MSEPLELHLTLPAGPARDAVASALTEQGFTVNPAAAGSLDVSRGSLGTTLIAGAFAGQDMHVRFDVHVRDAPEGAVATFVHSAAGGFFKGGAVGAVKAGDVVREAAHVAGVRLAQQGLIVGAVPVAPSPGADAGATSYSSTPPTVGPPMYAGAAPVPSPVDYANRTNVVAIFAIVLGFVVPIGGIVAGAVGLAQVKRTGEKGRGLAIAGIVVGSVMTVLGTIAVIAFFAFFVIAGAAGNAAATGDGGLLDPSEDVPAEVLSLQIGQCLDDVSTGIITSDNIVDCDVAHTYEVFGEVIVPDGSFPGDDQMEATAQRSCDEAFASFVGVSYDDSTLEYTYVAPTSDTWEVGDRQIACLITDPAGETTGSLENSGR
jgi:hypothetical protein